MAALSRGKEDYDTRFFQEVDENDVEKSSGPGNGGHDVPEPCGMCRWFRAIPAQRKRETGSGTSGEVIEISFPTYMAGENVGAVFFLPQVERFNKAYEGKYKITIEEVPQAAYAIKLNSWRFRISCPFWCMRPVPRH